MYGVSATFDRNEKRLLTNDASKLVPMRAFLAFCIEKSKKKEKKLKSARSTLFSALGGPNSPIFGLETNIVDIYERT